MVQHENWHEEILTLFYGESQKTLAEIAAEFGVPLKECELYFDSLQKLSDFCQKLPENLPSRVVMNKIIAEAQGASGEMASAWGWFKIFWRPSAALASMTLVLLAGFLTWQIYKTPETTAVNDLPFSHNLRFFKNQYVPQKTPYQIKPVSFGNSYQVVSIDDNELDQKILTKSALNQKELESLFFRAREYHQLGYYQRALQDYRFIARFYPKFHLMKSVQLYIASCYESLQENDDAISVLQKYEEQFGSSKDIEMWIDELKSITF